MGQVKRQLVIWGAIAATTAVLPGLALADSASPDFGGHHGGQHGQHGESKLAVAGRAIGKAEKNGYGMEIRGRSGDKPTDAGGMVRFAHRGESESDGLVGQITCLSKDSAGVVSVTGTINRSRTKSRDGKGMKPGAETAAQSDDGTALLDAVMPWSDDETAQLAADDAESSGPTADNPAPPAVPGAPSAPSMPAPPGQDKDPNHKHDHGKGGGELAGKDFAFTIDVPGKPQHFSQPKIGDKGTLAACSGGGAPVEVKRGHFRTREADAKNDKSGKDGGDHHGWFGGHRHGGDKADQ
jgi:hypothetical protein